MQQIITLLYLQFTFTDTAFLSNRVILRPSDLILVVREKTVRVVFFCHRQTSDGNLLVLSKKIN